MRHNLRFPALLFAGFLLAARSPGARCAEAKQDPEAVALARKTLQAMGGEEAFAKLRTLRFDFAVIRGGVELARFRHVWDRYDGRYRVEGKTKDGKDLLILFNVNDKAKGGRVWVGGEEASGAELEKYREFGYDRFINDTYWLLMPAKMLDPGVNLAYEGEVTDEGKRYRVVRLTFDNVGLTPGDSYWAYISPETGLMERWDFVLQDQKKKEDRTTFLWGKWEEIAGVRLSLSKQTPDAATIIAFDHVSGSASADDSVFQPPGAPSPIPSS